MADAVGDGGDYRTVLSRVRDRLIDKALGVNHSAAPAQRAMGHRSAGQVTDGGYRRWRSNFPVLLVLPVVEVDEVVGDMVLPHKGGQLPGCAGHSNEEGGASLEEDHRPLRHPGKRCVVEHDGAQGGGEELLHQGVRPQFSIAAVASGDLGTAILLTQPHDVVSKVPQTGRASRVGAKPQKGTRAGSPLG